MDKQHFLRNALQLYAVIKRFHRSSLPPHFRDMGDKVVGSEFRAFWDFERAGKATDGHRAEFFGQWSSYLASIRGAESADTGRAGGAAPPAVNAAEEIELDRLTPEQLQQLARLRQEALRAGDALLGRGRGGGGGGGEGK